MLSKFLKDHALDFQFLGGPGLESSEYLLFLADHPLCKVMDGLASLLVGADVLTGPLLQLMELRV